MYKMFVIIYNSGCYSSNVPHTYYIAQNKEEVIANSKRYKEFTRHVELFGGEISITEVNFEEEYDFENLKDFNINFTRKENNNV